MFGFQFLVIIISLLCVMGVAKIGIDIEPWSVAKYYDSFTLESDGEPILSGATLLARPAENWEPREILLTATNSEGKVVSAKLTPLAAYVLHESSKKGSVQ